MDISKTISLLIFTSVNLNCEICFLNVSLNCFSWVNNALQSKQVGLLVLVCGSQGPFPWHSMPPLKVGEWLGAAGEQLCQHLPCACRSTTYSAGESGAGLSPLSSKESRAVRAALCSGRARSVRAINALYFHLPLNRDPALGPPCLPSALPESRWGPATACHIQCVSAQEMVVP